MDSIAAMIVWIVIAVAPFGPARIEVQLPATDAEQPRVVRSVGVALPGMICTRSASPECRPLSPPVFPMPPAAPRGPVWPGPLAP